MFFNTLLYLGDYIGGPALSFLALFCLVAVFRMILSFVFKFFRMRLDYPKTYDKFYDKYLHE